MPRVKIRGILTEQDNYQRWVVFLTAKNFQSPFYQVRPNGRFLIEMLKVEPGNYRMHFGVKSKINSDYSSLVIPVYRPEINVGIIPTK